MLEPLAIGKWTLKAEVSDDSRTSRSSGRTGLISACGSRRPIASAAALLLGAIGIYGVISYMVSLRTREIGVRMALGAAPSQIGLMVSRQGLTMAALGVIIGLIAAGGLTRYLRALLFEISPTDPLTLGAVALGLLAVALAASWLPARRAARVEPAVALRSE